MTTWVKQLTRENTLLDRSLRAIAYATSVHEIGKANMGNCPVVGKGKITSFYYSPHYYKQQQEIIIKEFSGDNVGKLGNAILKYLEEAYAWVKQNRERKLGREDFANYYQQFNLHHAHGRGAIVYSYWGEPIITAKLRAKLESKVPAADVDETLSVLSSPRAVLGLLTELYHPHTEVAAKKAQLLRKLDLDKESQELVAILEWFTLLYEFGERVSSLLYEELVQYLQHIVSAEEMNNLEWYDPTSFEHYFSGKKLSDDELAKRKQFYILFFEGDQLKIVSGDDAQQRYDLEFTEVPAGQMSQIREIKGTVASKGKASGSVKIVITQEDQHKMQQGDILVSTMTTPRLMTAVHKAAAIVTDEGGMTAHAAIVSRELNIPCIVGTKIATQVFKDGDMVEVDANHGIVRKLS